MEEVAIIGAGMAGLTLALTLSKHSIPCRIYESRASTAGPSLGGAMMLSPNSLILFDRLGIYQDLQPLSYPFQNVYYKDAAREEETLDAYPMGGEKTYGYPALRTYRRDLHSLLVRKCVERGVAIEYDSKFTGVVSEGEESVTFSLADGSEKKARLLVASDGIHSTVRAHVTELKPVFAHLLAVVFAAETAALRIPEDKNYEFPVTLLSKAGNLVMAPQCPDGREMMTGRQFPVAEELSRQGWDELAKNKEKLKSMLRQDIDQFPDIAQSALVDALDRAGAADTLYIWPFYKLPPLPSWVSGGSKRVVLVGDAAHAIPPTTGQGMGMAVEDGVTLGSIIAAASSGEGSKVSWDEGVEWWQDTRQKRVHELVKLTMQLNNRRLPLEKQAELPKEQLWVDESATNPRQMAWLFEPGVVEEVEKWLESREKK